jgi:hypothetical protein
VPLYFYLKTSERKAVNVPQKTSVQYDIVKMDIETGEVLQLWERLDRIRMSEFLRLKRLIS